LSPSLRAVLFFLYSGEVIFTSPGFAANGASKSPNAKEFCASGKAVYLAADKVLQILPSLLLG